MSDFNSKKMEEIVNDLSFPRLSGSIGDPKAVDYCKTLFNSINLNLIEENFNATKFWVSTVTQLGMLLAIILSSLMTFFLFTTPWANIIIIGIVIILVIWGLQTVAGSGNLKPIGHLLPTKNLWINISSKNEKKGNIIISGHYDSKSQPLTTMQRSVCFALGGLSLLLLLIIYIIGIIFDFSNIHIPDILSIMGIILQIILFIFVIPLVFNNIGNKSPGALDNASSIAVLYELGKKISMNPLENYEIILLITGAEEVGMMGAREWIKQHKKSFPPENTYNINIDMVGWDLVDYIEVMTEVGFPKKKVSKYLNGIAFDVAKENNINLKGFWMPIGASTDSGVFAAQGYERTDFVVMDAAKKTHQKNDTPDKFSGKKAVYNCEIIYGMLKRIDSENL